MRIAGLLALIIFFPAFASAAPLVNINTADAATLDGLPYISLSLGEAVVAYRTANGPFAVIEDIMKVNGIKSGIFSHIQSLITVGDAAPDASIDTTASSTPPEATSATVTETTPPSGGGAPEYVPIPTLRIITDKNRIVSSGADTAFTVAVYDGRGNKRDDAVVSWSFGDGMRKIGASVLHPYYDPGEYLAVVHATTPDGGNVQNEIVVTVKDARIIISAVSSRGITLANNDSRTLDLSLWRLSEGGQEFKIPEDTHILAAHSILFPSQVIELPATDSAYLLYPSGEVAAAYPSTPAAQPSPSTVSYTQVSEVEPIASARTNAQVHDEAVTAPTVATELAAVGASTAGLSKESPSTPAILRSPWTLSFLGVMALAGGAFILL